MKLLRKDKTDKSENSKTLGEIEKRLLEIEEEKPRRIHNLSENYSASFEDELKVLEIIYLDTEKVQLQLKRQFILDRRSDWKRKILWNIVIPILMSAITTYLIS